MTQPSPNWNLVKVKGQYVGTDGTPIEGRVTFTPRAARVVDAQGLVTLLGRTISATLVNGCFEVLLPAGDDPDITPSGFTFSIVEDFIGGESYEIEVPLAANPLGIDISALDRATPNAGVLVPLPLGDHLVIQGVYLHGGSAGATYRNKYIKLFNPTNNNMILNGKSLQYRSASSTAIPTDIYPLAGTLAPRTTYLVRCASNGAVGEALTGVALEALGLNPAASGGTIMLVNGTAGVLPTDSAVIDRIGWGTSNAPEGTAATPSSVTTAMKRNRSGADTGNNAADFVVGSPTPNSVD